MTVLLAVLALGGIVVSGYGTYLHIRNRLNDALNARILRTAEEVARVAVDTAAASPGPLWTDEEARTLGETLRVIRRTARLESVFIFDPELRSLADANPRVTPGRPYSLMQLSVDAVRGVLAGRATVDDRLSVGELRFHNATVPLAIDGVIRGGIYVQANAEFDADLMRLRRHWQVAGTLSVLVSAAFLAVLAVVTHHIVRIRTELNRRSRLGLISLLSAGISHDIKNPLGSILAACELLRTTVAGDKEAEELIGYIREGADRILNITRTLLDTGRASEKGPVKLKEIASALAKQLTPVALEKGVKIEEDVRSEWVGWGSQSAFRMALANIVKNAVEAVAAGEGRVTLTGRREGRRVAVLVSDNGPGIPSALRRKIFDPLVTTKATGSGIGLPVTRQILEDMQGSLELETEPGAGTTFTLWIPEAASDDGDNPAG